MRYGAFISYSYRDRRDAMWLHRALESYRVPRRLQGRETAEGMIGKRLPPVFRDRDELAASADLGEAVRAALEQTRWLIVICSPAGAASRWVNEEIRSFAALGGRERIRCLIVAGEPHAADPANECLPPALFENGGTEPLAADIRKHQDGRASARLKLIASMLGLPYDELRQREAQRRQRRLAILAAAATVGFVVMAGLALFAMLSRAEAVRQRDIARQRTQTAERTVSFVKSMFEVSDPSEARGATITAREVLDRGATRIRSGLADEPAVRAELGITLGEVYGSLGLFHQADALIRWTFGIPHHQPGIAARQLLALGDEHRNQGEYGAAVPLYTRAIADVRAAGGERDDLLPRILVGLAEAQTGLRDFPAADRNARAALERNLRAGGANDPEVARDLEALANNAFTEGKPDAARPLAERALAIRLRAEGPNSPSVSDNINMLGSIAKARGDEATAERLFRSRLAIDERVLGRDHPDVATSLNNLARVLVEQRKYAQAAPLLERAVAIDMRERGAMHDDMTFLFSNLALARQGLGARTAADALFTKAIDTARATENPALGQIFADQAALRCEEGKPANGLALVKDARPLVKDAYAAEPWRSAWVDNVDGGCLLAAGKKREALPLLLRSDPIIRARWRAGTHFAAAAAARLASAR